MAAPEKEKPDQIQDYQDSLINSRKQGSQGLSDGRQIPQTWGFV
jgi:hypothetical protein